MPEICRFHGIIIRMYYLYLGVTRDGPPSFHAICDGREALVGIDPVVALRGGLPEPAWTLVQRWAALNRDGLLANWQRLLENRPAEPLPPLP